MYGRTLFRQHAHQTKVYGRRQIPLAEKGAQLLLSPAFGLPFHDTTPLHLGFSRSFFTVHERVAAALVTTIFLN